MGTTDNHTLIAAARAGDIQTIEELLPVTPAREKNIRLPIKTRAVAKIADSAVIAKINNGMVTTEKTVFSFDRYNELNDMKQKYRIEVTVENKYVP